MSRFDINNVRDFQALTLGNTAGILQTLSLAGRDPTKWQLLEASYLSRISEGEGRTPVLFHIFKSKSDYQAGLPQVQDSGGRRKVKYRFPYVDGQTTDDLGREPSTFTIEAIIHGNNYLEALNRLIQEFNYPTPGTFIHPVRGSMPVAVEGFQITHKSDSRKAAQFNITFIEHNFDLTSIEQVDKDKSVKGALATALAAVAFIDNAVTNVTGAVQFALSVRNSIAALLAGYKTAFTETLQKLNQNFNTFGSADIPSLLPTNQGGTGGPGTGANFPLVGTPLDDTPVAVVPALAANDMTKLVNATRAQLTTTLAAMEAAGDGQGSLDFYDDILALKQGAIELQNVLETGIASSQAQVIDYTLPRDMSLREVAYVNKLTVDRFNDVAILNPQLDSVNQVLKGTTVKVPIA